MTGEFVEGWFAAQVLGEGAYGEVRLLVHARTGACVALKAVRAGAGAGDGAGAGASREAALHRALRHPHVLRCFGERHHRHLHYLFLEYAQGGELFDRIEPDVGMGERAARRYWRQALAGLRYLHERGVAHRDLKPENLLLDHHDQIKISDFGMATLFRHGSRERLLTRVCGTVPYAAPEVLRAASRPYRAPPADLWAAAVVLLAMLAGELPWERAHEDEPRYAAWSRWARGEGGEGGEGEVPGGVWRKLGGDALALLRRLLQPEPARRPALAALLRHRWLRDPGPVTVSPTSDVSRIGRSPPGTRRVRAGDPWSGRNGRGRRQQRSGARNARRVVSETANEARVWSSQPAARAAPGEDGAAGVGALSAAAMDALLSHSQPAHADDLLLASPPDAALCTQQGVLARLVRRMTRVWVRCDAAAAERALLDVLRRKGYAWRHLQPRLLAIESACGVKMRAWAAGAGAVGEGGEGEGGEARAVLEFRRSRGCGLAFKRRYLELRDALAPLAAPPPALPPLAPPPAPPALPMDLDGDAGDYDHL